MIEIYTITFPDSTVYRYTSTVDSIVVGGDTYFARTGLIRGEVNVSVTECDSAMTLILPCTDAAVRSYMESPPSLPVFIEVRQVLNGGSVPWFKGIVSSVSVSGISAEFRLIGNGVAQLSQATALRYTAQCRHALYGPACRVDKNNHKTTGNLTDVESNGLVLVSSDWDDFTQEQWIGGAIDIGGELRTIISQPASDKIRIDRVFIGLLGTEAFEIFEGCNKTNATCREKFNNLINFGGIPNLPRRNPFAQDVNVGSDQ
jgi:uncharacterized phage protein (TIGR02218 family)